MAIFTTLLAKLGFETSGWTSGTNTAVKDLDKLDKKSKGFFKDLKSNFGKGSVLGQSIKLAAGGGAIAGLTALANQAKEFATELSSLNDKYHQGDISQREYAEGLAHAIPIVGGFAAAIDATIDAINGQAAAIKRADAVQALFTKNLDDARKKKVEYRKETEKLVESIEDENTRMQQEVMINSQQDEASKMAVQAQVDAQNQIVSLHKRANAAIHQDRIDQLQKEVEAATRDRDSTANIYGKNAATNRLGKANIELSQLMRDKNTILQAQADAELEIQRHLEYKLGLAQDEAAKEDLKKEQENAKVRRDAMIDQLEARKRDLQELIKESEKGSSSVAVQTTQSARGAQFALYSPTVSNPMQKVLDDSLRELKSIDDGIKTLKTADSGVTVSIGGAG